jgi:HAD superfamily phosphoserine phosphatase-like hydrolase
MHVARRRQQWRLLLLPFVALAGFGYSLRLIDRSRLKAINLRLLVGSRFSRTEISPLHHAAIEQIAADREAGYRLLLATASFHLYVDAIARRLGIDDVLATRLDEPDGADHIHARLAGDNCYGEAKFARISDWLAANEITRDQAHVRAYSDHVSDHPMLRFADEAVATTPSRKLKLLAPKMGWQVVDWRAGK